MNNPIFNNLPLRGSPQLYDIFKSFGYNIPMPIKSKNPLKQKTDGMTSSPGYADFEELMQLSPDERLQASYLYEKPSLLLEQFLKRKPLFIDDYISNNKFISETDMLYLQNILRASKNQIHIEIDIVIAKKDEKLRDLDLKTNQTNTGVYNQVIITTLIITIIN